IKSILLLAIPDEYLLKFHNVPDAKSLWDVIKYRFGGNEESKKMQKNVLKHHFENFVTASNETLDKAYDRFQKLISQLEIHGAYVSKEDINQKFLKSLYNNLKVYEDELKRSSGSNSASQNLAFLSSKNTNSTNEVSQTTGQRQWLTTVIDGGPPVNHRWTTAGLPVNHRSTVVDCQSRRVNSWVGSVLGWIGPSIGPGQVWVGSGS
ncbi:hypothetical protein Tco_1461779, partial [Tanacetum coccineum]